MSTQKQTQDKGSAVSQAAEKVLRRGRTLLHGAHLPPLTLPFILGSACWLGEDNGKPYMSDFKLVPLSSIAAKTKHMPKEFLSGHNNVSKAFLEYCLPLVGPLPGFERL